MDNQRQEWLEARRQGIGASDAVVILIGSQWRTEHDVLASKFDIAEELDNDDIRRGNLYEPICLAQWAAAHPDYTVMEGHRDPLTLTFRHGYCHASLDAVAVGPNNEVIILEVKSPRGKKARDTELDGPAPEWQVQVQYQLAIAERSGAELFTGWGSEVSAYVLVWHSEEARYHEHAIAPTPDAERWVQYCHEWYERHVVDQAPLETTAPPVAIPHLEADADLSGTPDGAVVAWYAAACEAVKKAEADKDAAAAALTEVATAHSARRLVADGCRITRIVNKGRTSLDTKAARAAHPEIPWTDYERTGGEYLTWRVTGGGQ